jgi:hypothetical protein
MPKVVKLLTGLVAALIAGWVSHGPLGQGKAFIDGLQAAAEAELREAAVPRVTVRFARDPLQREAILIGNANDYQREGMGLYPGLNDRMRAIAGVSGVRWDDSDCCAREE